MIDIHTHILPNVDDGATSTGESLQMIERMERDGVTHIVATPHCNQNAPLFREDIKPRVEELNALLVSLKSQATVLAGSEISLFSDADFRAHYESGEFCHLGDTPLYSLIEFPWSNEEVPKNALETIDWMISRGTTPIIAHPERTPFLRESPRFIQELVSRGAILQLTSDSVCGFGSTQSKTMSEMILRAFEPVVLASDSHNLERCSRLSAGYDQVAQKFGSARAELLRSYSNSILQNILNA